MFIINPDQTSWVPVVATSDFPIQNLPFGRARLGDGSTTLVSIIGDWVIDLSALKSAGLLSTGLILSDFDGVSIEDLRELRSGLFDLLRFDNGRLRDDDDLRPRCFLPVAEVSMLLPMRPSAFVDFYSGMHHASNVGKMFRPDQPPLLPNYLHIPIAYNGRASSVVVDGTPIRRPMGQTKGANDAMPAFGPSKELDFELEMGFFLGGSTQMGEATPIAEVESLMLGFVLVNDWSARDLQRWEYQPLGPFLAKSFATSISAWIVLPDALEPFRMPELVQDPAPLPYLQTSRALRYDIVLEVDLQSTRIADSNAKHLYWSFDQQLAHQSSNGTPLFAGDLYASGTISGETPGTFGSMLELTWRGTQPIDLGDHGTRSFLNDGDRLVMRGYAQGDGYRVGFGEVSGTVVPA